ncbi:MAG: hypothetical protein RR089_01140 [Acidaminococcaceae bacterium]
MKNMKTALILGALIAAFGLTTAFAATDDNQKGSTYPRCPGRTALCATGDCDYYHTPQAHAHYLQVHKDRLAQKVADGRLTQAQADEILSRIKTNFDKCHEGNCLRSAKGHNFHKINPMHPGPVMLPPQTPTDYEQHPHKNHERLQQILAEQASDGDLDGRPDGMAWRERPQLRNQHNGIAVLAELTGRDADSLLAECNSRLKTPYQMAQEAGVLKEYQAKRLAYVTSQLQAAVADGRLTQAQADQKLSRAKERIEKGERPEPRRLHHGRAAGCQN